MDLESCMGSSFDSRVGNIYSNDSISSVFQNAASETAVRASSCVLISAVVLPPESSLFLFEIMTENAATYPSIDEEPLQR